MKLKNKRTGEIAEFRYLQPDYVAPLVLTTYENDKPMMYSYNSLAELNEEWEDYEEPKGSALDLMILTLINFIENEPDEDKVDLEDCKKMLDKLKAWKRLKDKGFRFTLTPGVGSLDITPGKFQIEINADMPAKWFCCDAVQKDLDDCFGGEE